MPSSSWRIVALVLSGLALLATAMPAPAEDPKPVLIATETSVFKDAVVARVAEALARDGHAVRTIALEAAADERLANYRAILLVSTCHAWRPGQEVRELLGRAGTADRKKLVVVTTAGSGKCDFSAPGVDLVSSASKRTRIDDVSSLILDKLRSRLTPP